MEGNESLKEKCLRLRAVSDYRLESKKPVIMMLDGRAFSSYTRNFEKPYDKKFINAMNETAKFLCEQISGAKIGYVQSDEISIYVSDLDSERTEGWFGYRLEKLCSIAASMATGMFIKSLCESFGYDEVFKVNRHLPQFDCKAWNVEDMNDVYAWFLYRNIDCVRNSKSMLAQTHYSHKELYRKNCDEQIAMVREEKGIDWYGSEFTDGERYGRLIYKVEKEIASQEGIVVKRMKFDIFDGFDFAANDDSRTMFEERLG